jgi:hypothetical protein
MYRVELNFQKISILILNAEGPKDAAMSAKKLLDTGRSKPIIEDIRVFEIEDEDNLESVPIYRYVE